MRQVPKKSAALKVTLSAGTTTLDMATSPGAPTAEALVVPRSRSRWLADPPASVVIWALKFALAPVTAPPPLRLVQPKLVGSAVLVARTVPSASTRSASVHPLSPWKVIVPRV
jgi:hypothetical protein